MFIERDLIKQAEEKLGDKCFDIIMNNYGVSDYDHKNMKCRCPFHNENTPSFVYNKKEHYCKCFGCGKRVDIIDSYMATGKTFVESVQALFEEAGIQYAFGEHHIKDAAYNYRYPEAPSKDNDMAQVIAYWNHRGISEKSLRYCDVRADERNNSVFLTYDLNDVLKVVKYKPSHRINKQAGEPKMWFQKDKDKEDLLFNMNRINTREPLLICAGESDLLSAVEAGYTNVVTGLNGEGSFGWIEHCWDFLDQFNNIIVCYDNDPTGYKGRDELIFRLGSWRCRVVEIPIKGTYNGKEYPCDDLNDMLNFYGKEAVYQAIINAKDTPVKSVVDVSDVTEVSLKDMQGIPTGFESVDAELYKLYYGTVTLLSGRPGSGKSSLINSIIANAMERGIASWQFSAEMPNWLNKQWLRIQIGGPRNVVKTEDEYRRVYWDVRPQTMKAINQWMNGKLYLYRDEMSSNEDDIISSMIECVQKFGTRLCVIDNLMCVNLNNAESDLAAQEKFMKRLIKLAIKYNIAIILVSHPRKASNLTSPTSDVTLSDIAGSSALGNLAHRAISLRRISQAEHEKGESKFSAFNVKMTITKDRLLGRSNDTAIGLYYDNATRRFFTNYDEYARQYGWDTNQYANPVPMPECLQNNDEGQRYIAGIA